MQLRRILLHPLRLEGELELDEEEARLKRLAYVRSGPWLAVTGQKTIMQQPSDTAAYRRPNNAWHWRHRCTVPGTS